MRRVVQAALVAALWPSSSLAGDYWSVAMGEHYTTYDFVDASSIRPRGDGISRAWITSVVAGPGRSKYPYRTEIKEEEFDCTARQIAVLQDVSYDDGGAVTASKSVSAATRLDVVPGSWGFEELSFVCGDGAQWAANKDWLHIAVSPVEFADNSYNGFSAHVCTAERTRGCIVP